MKYYLAYGSNLNLNQMEFRCPDAEVVGVSEIPDYRLLFKGSKTGSYLTIEPCPGKSVPVGVWKISESDERNLDFYEGFPVFYYKRTIPVKVRGVRVLGTVYIMREDRKVGVPSEHYLSVCEEGYDDFGFDQEILMEAYDYSWKEVTA